MNQPANAERTTDQTAEPVVNATPSAHPTAKAIAKATGKAAQLEQQIQSLETTLQQKRARLAQLKARHAHQARQQSRALDTRRKILVGAVVLKKAESNTAFAAQLQHWLDDGLTQDRDRQLFPGLDTGLDNSSKKGLQPSSENNFDVEEHPQSNLQSEK
jgi:hypothetical protein